MCRHWGTMACVGQVGTRAYDGPNFEIDRAHNQGTTSGCRLQCQHTIHCPSRLTVRCFHSLLSVVRRPNLSFTRLDITAVRHTRLNDNPLHLYPRFGASTRFSPDTQLLRYPTNGYQAGGRQYPIFLLTTPSVADRQPTASTKHRFFD